MNVTYNITSLPIPPGWKLRKKMKARVILSPKGYDDLTYEWAITTDGKDHRTGDPVRYTIKAKPLFPSSVTAHGTSVASSEHPKDVYHELAARILKDGLYRQLEIGASIDD